MSPSSEGEEPVEELRAEQLLDLLYDELRKTASSKMSREGYNLTLQPTSLVHEAWLRLGGENQPIWANKAHFFAAASEAMKRILIERARRRQAARHGGGFQRVEIEIIEGLPDSMNDDEHVISLGEALSKLAEEDPRKAELVQLRYFVGFTNVEAANALGISEPTARRWWAYARSWLYAEMSQE